MVAIVTGNGVGLGKSSAEVLGQGGQLGPGQLPGAAGNAYVNASNGNLIIQRQDELLIGRGPDIGVYQTYNSQGTFDFDNNDNWQVSLYRQLSNRTGTVNTAGSTITRTAADGTALVYTYDSTAGSSTLGKYVNKDGAGSYDTLTYTSGTNTWLWQDGDSRIKENYAVDPNDSSKWRITSVTDLDNNSLTYTYSTTSGLTALIDKVTSANGEITQLIYNSSKQLTQINVINSSSVTTTRIRYTYESTATTARLTSVSTDLTPADGTIADGKTYTTTYTYDGASKRIASITNSDGANNITAKVSFTYEQTGTNRLLTISDYATNSSTINNTTTLNYTSATTTTITNTNNAGTSFVTTLTYDTNKQLTNIQGPSGSGQNTSYTYNTNGDITQVTDNRGNWTKYTYDTQGNQLTQQDNLGNTIVRTYDSTATGFNQLLTQTVYTGVDATPGDATIVGTDAAQTTRYTYDSKNHLRFAISAEGRVTEYRYNAQGQLSSAHQYTDHLNTSTGNQTEALMNTWLTTTIKSKSQRTDYLYDPRGQLREQIVYTKVDATAGSEGNGIIDGTQMRTQYVYDQFGNLTQKIDARGVASGTANDYMTSYGYDGLNRLTLTKQYDATGLEANAVSTQVTYTDTSRQVKLTLANGLVTTSTYDLAGRLTSVQKTDATLTNLGTTSYAYDKLGNLRMVTDVTGQNTYYLYDSANRKVGEINQNNNLTEWVYNNNGQVIRTIQYKNAVTATLNATTALTNTLTTSGIRNTHSADRVARKLYDAAGRLAKEIDALGYVTEYQYDGASRLLKTIQYANALNATQLNAINAAASEVLPTDSNTVPIADSTNDRTNRNLYDNDSKLVGTLDAEGYLVEYTYDKAGRQLQKVRYATATVVANRANGALALLRSDATSVSADSTKHQTTNYIYDTAGQLTGVVDAENFLTEYQYDLVGNKTQEIRYATSITYVAGNTVIQSRPASNNEDQKITNTYDANNRITSSLSNTQGQVNGLLTNYTYDSVGNLTQAVKTFTGATSTQQRVQRNQYDSRGNLIAELSGEGVVALRELGATPTTAQINNVWNNYATRYTYDNAGRLISKLTPDGLFIGGAPVTKGNKTLYYYDQEGKLTYTVNALGEVSQTLYNSFDQVSETRRYNNRIASTTLAGLVGGDESAMTSVITGIGATNFSNIQLGYDKRGQLISTTDELLNINSRSYNAFGELNNRTDKIDGSSSALTSYQYDRRGLLKTTTEDVDTGFTRITQAVYDAFGRVTQTTDGRGNNITHAYDRLGREVTTTDALTKSTITTYDAFSRVLKQVDRNNTTAGTSNGVTYSYNSTARSMTMTTAEGVVVVTTKNQFGDTVSIKDGLNNTTAYEYNADGQLVHTVTPDTAENYIEYDTAGRVWITTDAYGIGTVYRYDAISRVVSKRVETDGPTYTTLYYYDAQGRQNWTRDSRGVWTRMDYDAKGQVTMVVVDPLDIPTAGANGIVTGTAANSTGLNLTTSYTYDARGKKLTVTEGAGTSAARPTRYDYDKLGRLKATVIDPGSGKLNLTTSYTYDQNDNVALKTDANGNKTVYKYDANNRLEYTVDALGYVKRNFYDANGNTIKTREYKNALAAATLTTLQGAPATTTVTIADNNDDRVTRYGYDKDNRLTYTTNAEWFVTRNEYDANGNVVKRTSYVNKATAISETGGAPTVTNNANDRIEQTVYDTVNQPIYTIDAEKYVTRLEYDLSGNVIQKTRYATALTALPAIGVAPSPVSSGKDQVTQYVYDNVNRLTDETRALGSTEEVTTHYDYDYLGNQTQITEAYGTANARVTQQKFDKAGRKTEVIDGEGKSTKTEYNAAGDIVKVIDALGNAGYYYTDAAGRVTLQVDPEGAVTQTQYDGLDNVTGITRYAVRATGALDVDIWPAIASSSGDQLETVSYDRLGRKTSVKTWFGSGVNDFYTESYTYTAFGDVESQTARNGQVTVYTYNKQSKKLSESFTGITVRNAANNGTVTLKNSYTYNAFGNLLTQTEADGALTTRTTAYVNDKLGRQVQTSQNVQTTTSSSVLATTQKTYDSRGNVVAEKDANNYWTYYYYDKQDRRAASVKTDGSYTTWAYDVLGNVSQETRYTNKVQVRGTAVLSATSSIQLVGSAPTTGNVVYLVTDTTNDRVTTYTYDRVGRQTGSKISNVTTGAYNTTTQQYQYGATDISTSTAYDALGNVTKQTDGNGNVTRHWYNKAGQAIAKLDAESYLTLWTRDVYGNIAQETRYANKVQATGSATLDSGIPNAVTAVPTGNSVYVLKDINNDRTTVISYDKLNRVVSENIKAVAQGEINAVNGVLTPDVGTNKVVTGTLDTANLSVNGLTNIDEVALSTGTVGWSGGSIRDSQITYHHTTTVTLPGDWDVSWTSLKVEIQIVSQGTNGTFLRVGAGYLASGQSSISVNTGLADGSAVTTFDPQIGIGSVRTNYYPPTILSYKIIVTDTVTNIKLIDKTVQNGTQALSTFYIQDQPAATNRVEFHYRVKGSSDAYTTVVLPQVLDATGNPVAGLYAFDYDSLPKAEYEFYYQALDSNGNVLNEQGVMSVVDGHMTSYSGDAVTRYQYDGLNNVIRKTDATNVVTDWVYDGLGRQTRQTNAQYIDYEGSLVRPITDYEYNGLNEVVREIKRGKDNASESDDRITSYSYGVGGRLINETDAAGAVTSYWYDANGNILQTTLNNRVNVDSQLVNDIRQYTYDTLNRQVKTLDVSTGLNTDIRFDSFGQVTGKRSYVGSASAQWDEFSEYDRAGRVWKSNTGDGVTKIYVRDSNGNATLTVNGTLNLRNMSLAAVLNQAETDRINEVPNQTFYNIDVFDGKNQRITSIQPEMLDNIVNITDAGNVMMDTGSVSWSGNVIRDSQITYHHTTTVTLPGDWDINWGTLKVDIQIVSQGTNGTFLRAGTGYLASGQTSININTGLADGSAITTFDPQLGIGSVRTNYYPPAILSYQIIVTDTVTNATLVNRTVAAGTQQLSTLYFDNQPIESSSLKLYYREKGSTGDYTQVNVPAVVNNVGTTLPGMYGFDYSGLPKASYEFYYQALDSQGTVVNEQSGVFNTLKLEGNGTISEGTETVKVYGNNIIKTGGGNVWGDADAYSVNAYTGGAYVSARAGQLDKHGMFGLSDNPTASKEYSTLNYAWYTVNNEDLRIYINGSDQGVFGTYSADDVLAVKYEGTTISFLKNGVVIQTFSTTASRSFYFDSSLYSPDYALNDIRFGATEASSVAAVLQQHILSKVGGGVAWNGEVRSNGSYTGTAYVSAQAGQTNLHGMFGMSTNPTVNTSTTIDYAWYLKADGTVEIYEGGQPSQPVSAFGSYSVTDTFSIAYSGNTVSYLKNGVVIKTTSTSANRTFYVDSSLYSPGFDLHNLKFGRTEAVAGYMSASATAVQYVKQPDDLSADKVTILRRQSYNAFGEVLNETDGNGNVTSFAYNTMGKLIRKTDPQVSITTASGQVQQASPVTEYTYDAVGRVIGYKDANGNLHMQAWMAGAPEGSEDMLSFEKHADGGTKTYMFDIFGNKRQETNEVGQDSWFQYDAMGRLTQSTGYVGNHRYAYDQEGQRISHLRATDNTFTAGDTEKTYFDSLGRITQTKSYMGFATTYSYTFSSNVAGLDGVTGSGWRKTTTNPDNRTLKDDMDMFNRVTWHEDLGGNKFNYHYNAAGWLTSQTGSTGQNIAYSYYQNGYLRAIHDKALGTYSHYEYDGNGNKTYEAYTTLKDPQDIFAGFSNYYQQTHISYDALNRISTISDPKAVINYTYDAVGNRRSVSSTYYQVNGTQQPQQYWYKYDSMNRFLISMGSLVNGNIVVGNEGVDITYNTIGQRMKVINGNATASQITTEVYGYTNEGYLNTVKINGVLRSMRENDAYGRVWRMTEYNASGGITYRVNTNYDADSRMTLQTDYTGATTSYEYYTGSGSNYAAGAAGELARTVNDSNGAAAGGTIVTTHYSYEYWDEAKVTAITANPYNASIKKSNAAWKPGYSDISYDVNGHMTGAIDRQGNRNIQYVTDAQGKILLREEVTGTIPRPTYRYYGETYNPGSVANKVNRYIYVDGKQVGEINNTGPSRVDYVQSMAARNNQTGNYAGWQPITSADFDQSYEPISPTYPGPVAGNYTVRSGDTLQSIAQTLWGDSSLWYVLADANGLTAADPLVAGMQLTVPNKVTNVHNNAGTFRPYDPGEAMGDINPTIPAMPKPPKNKGGCGGIGTIIAAIVTVVVTIYTAGAMFATSLQGFATTMSLGVQALSGLGGAMIMSVAAAAGSIAGQLTGMALGSQDKFSWGAVASSALGAAVNSWGMFNANPTSLPSVAINAGLSNSAGQLLGNITGMQKGFDWSSLAVSAISAPVGNFASEKLIGQPLGGQFPVQNQSLAKIADTAIKSGVQDLTKLAIKGGKLSWASISADVASAATFEIFAGPVAKEERDRYVQNELSKNQPVVYSSGYYQYFSTDSDGKPILSGGMTKVERYNWKNPKTGEIENPLIDSEEGRKLLSSQGADELGTSTLVFSDNGMQLGETFGLSVNQKNDVGMKRYFGDTRGSNKPIFTMGEGVDPQYRNMIDPGSHEVNPFMLEKLLDGLKTSGASPLVAIYGSANTHQTQLAFNSNLLNIVSSNNGNSFVMGVTNPTTSFAMDNLFNAALPRFLDVETTNSDAIKHYLTKVTDKWTDPLAVKVIAHSESTIHTSIAMDKMKDTQKASIDYYAIGNASGNLVKGLGNMHLYELDGDPVSGYVGGKLYDKAYFKEHYTYRPLASTYQDSKGYANNHSQHLYLQNDKLALDFGGDQLSYSKIQKGEQMFHADFSRVFYKF
jgi:YD repeat-containing protein